MRHQAVAYRYWDDYKAVISNSQKALALFRWQNNKKGISASLNTIATTQLNLERLNEAEETYLEAMDISIQVEDKSMQTVVLQNLGTVHIGLGELSDAEQ